MTIDINQALGDQYEYSPRTVLPDSYYPVTLHVVGTGLSEPKMVDAKDEDGNVIIDPATGKPQQEEGGNSPFVELEVTVTDGPFAGSIIRRKAHIVPGKQGGAIGRWLGAARAITRTPVQTQAMAQKFGIALPTTATPQGKETPEQAARRAVRQALAAGFYALEPAQRLAFIKAALMVDAWEGKTVICKLSLDQSWQDANGKRYNEAQYKLLPAHVQETLKGYSNNDFAGFLPLDDETHGLKFVKGIEFPKQEKAFAIMNPNK